MYPGVLFLHLPLNCLVLPVIFVFCKKKGRYCWVNANIRVLVILFRLFLLHLNQKLK